LSRLRKSTILSSGLALTALILAFCVLTNEKHPPIIFELSFNATDGVHSLNSGKLDDINTDYGVNEDDGAEDNSEYMQASKEIDKFCSALLPPAADKTEKSRLHRRASAHIGVHSTVDIDRAECRTLVSRAAAENVTRSRRRTPDDPITYLQARLC